MKKRIPAFKDEAAERRFWQTHDTTEYFDWSAARQVVFPHLKPSAPAGPPPRPVAPHPRTRHA